MSINLNLNEKKYLIGFDNDESFKVCDEYYNTKKEAIMTIENLKNKSINLNYEHKVYTVELIKILMDYTFEDDDEGGELAHIYATAKVDNIDVKVEYNIQLNDCVYRSQMGGKITNSKYDEDNWSKEELLIFQSNDFICYAENYAEQKEKERYTLHDANFNCAIDSRNLYIREDHNKGLFVIISLDNSVNLRHDYGNYLQKFQQFDSLKEANDFLDDYRTDDYQDCRGLYNFLTENE